MVASIPKVYQKVYQKLKLLVKGMDNETPKLVDTLSSSLTR